MQRVFEMAILLALLQECVTVDGQWYPATIFDSPINDSIKEVFQMNSSGPSRQRYEYLVQTEPNYTDNRRYKWHFKNRSHTTIVLPSVYQSPLTSPTLYHSEALHRKITNDGAVTNPSANISIIDANIRNDLNAPSRRVVRKKCKPLRSAPKRQTNRHQRKDPRFLEVFEVVEFDHVTCTSSSGLDGVCLHVYECIGSGGTVMGSCADGYGSCCITQFSCDDKTSALSGWFINPGFPSPSSDRISCALTIHKNSPDIVQIRLDLKNFELLPPTEGSCETDQFIVSGQNVNNIIPILCGINSGQHIYIEVENAEGPIYLTVQTVSTDSRLFSIKMNQLTAADELLAPSNCLQLFTEPHGYLSSFNYDDKSEIGIARIPSYLNNLNYAICILRDPTSCSITYTNAGDLQIVNYDLEGLPTIPPGQAGVEIFNCPSDWLLMSAERLCGEKLNDGSILQDFSLDAPVTDVAAGPIVVWFRSDGSYVGKGFKIEYEQNPCSRPV